MEADGNNQYGWAMSIEMSYGDFEWVRQDKCREMELHLNYADCCFAIFDVVIYNHRVTEEEKKSIILKGEIGVAIWALRSWWWISARTRNHDYQTRNNLRETTYFARPVLRSRVSFQSEVDLFISTEDELRGDWTVALLISEVRYVAVKSPPSIPLQLFFRMLQGTSRPTIWSEAVEAWRC